MWVKPLARCLATSEYQRLARSLLIQQTSIEHQLHAKGGKTEMKATRLLAESWCLSPGAGHRHSRVVSVLRYQQSPVVAGVQGGVTEGLFELTAGLGRQEMEKGLWGGRIYRKTERWEGMFGTLKASKEVRYTMKAFRENALRSLRFACSLYPAV